MNSIHDIEHQIRDVINKPRIKHAIMQDHRDWMQLCASLDVLGDTQLAIDAYLSIKFSDEAGTAYLLVFGVLQACFLQQDATVHLSEVLKIGLPADPGLAEVRSMRNDIAGHPTKRGSNRARTTHAISRPSLSKWNFDVVSMPSATDGIDLRRIDIRKGLELQQKGIANRLRLILEELKKREREHGMSFQAEKLAELFPPTLSYHLEKIFEGTHNDSSISLAEANLKLVHDVVERFRSALTDRGELPANELANYRFDELRNPFERLREYFAGNSSFNAEDAYAFAFFLRAKVQELAELAQEIDESYEAAASG